MAQCDAEDLIAQACASGFTCRNEPELLALLNQLLCNLGAEDPFASVFINLSNQTLIDSGGVATVDWGTGFGSLTLKDNSGNIRVRWGQGILLDAVGVNVLDWTNLELTGAWTINGVPMGPRNQSGAASPVGAATPDYVGQMYTKTTATFAAWTSVGLTSVDWFQIA